MDVLDAGVFVSKWEAEVPREAQLVLWGPLQAKEMGLDGWEVQDGGETGFVVHNPGTKLTMGRATSTLIFVRRLRRAYLTVYFGGYPTDAPSEQRHLDMQKVVSACEMFLGRLAKRPVQFVLQGELTLVDNVNDAAVSPPGARAAALEARRVALQSDGSASQAEGGAPAPRVLGGSNDPRMVPRGTIEDGEPTARRVSGRGSAEIWEV